MTDLLDLQALLMDDARKPEIKPSVRAMVSRAWKELQELRLRLQMKPAPKPIDVQPRQPRRRGKSAVPVDTTQADHPSDCAPKPPKQAA